MQKSKKERKPRKKKSKSTVANVYSDVVDDVINNVRSDFHAEGLDDNVLEELQTLWEHKLMQSGALREAPSHESAEAKPVLELGAGPPVHDLNAPYSATEEPYVAPPSDAMFGWVNPSTGSREPAMFQYMPEYMPAGPSEESVRQSFIHHLPLTIGNGTPSYYMQQPAPWMNHQQPAPWMDQKLHQQPEPWMDQKLHQQPAPWMNHQQPAPWMDQKLHQQPEPWMDQKLHQQPEPWMDQKLHQQPAPWMNHLQPAPWMDQKPLGLKLNMNETYEERHEGDHGLAQQPVPVRDLPITKDFLNISMGKRKYEDISPGYYFQQRDGTTDGASDDKPSTSIGDAVNIKEEPREL